MTSSWSWSCWDVNKGFDRYMMYRRQNRPDTKYLWKSSLKSVAHNDWTVLAVQMCLHLRRGRAKTCTGHRDYSSHPQVRQQVFCSQTQLAWQIHIAAMINLFVDLKNTNQRFWEMNHRSSLVLTKLLNVCRLLLAPIIASLSHFWQLMRRL